MQTAWHSSTSASNSKENSIIIFSPIEQESGRDTTKAERSEGTKEHEPRMGDLQTPERQEQYLDDGAE